MLRDLASSSTTSLSSFLVALDGGRCSPAVSTNLALAATSQEENTARSCHFVEESDQRVLRCDRNPTAAQMLGRWKLDRDHAEAVARDDAETMDTTVSSSSTMFSISSDDEEEEVSSSSSSSDTLSDAKGPLHSLTSLYEALPIKTGLSRHFSGKSQSFSSLANVFSVVDLAKPGNPFVRRRKASKSLPKHGCYHPRSVLAAGISKRPVSSSHCRSFYMLAAATSLHHEAINPTMVVKD